MSMSKKEDTLNSRLSPDERRENARKAGKASGAARRRRRMLRDYLCLLLSLDMLPEEKQAAAQLGVPAKDMTNTMQLAISLFRRAAGGDLAAIKEVRTITEEGEAAHGLVVNIIDDLK